MCVKSERKRIIKYGIKDLEKEYGKLTFGKLLKAHRLGEEITQADMSKKLKISRQKLNDLENGRRFPSPKVAAATAEKLGEHVPTWISIVIEEMLRKDGFEYKVILEI